MNSKSKATSARRRRAHSPAVGRELPRPDADRRERLARLGQLACELDDLVLEIANGPLDDEPLHLAPSAGYLAISLRALDAVLDEVEFGKRPAALRQAA